MQAVLDFILDFWEDHRVLSIIISVIFGLIILAFIIRGVNSGKQPSSDFGNFQKQEIEEEVDYIVREADPEFKSTAGTTTSLVKEEEPIDTSILEKPAEAETVNIHCDVTGHTVVPQTNMDGSHYKDYFNAVKISDFDTYFGTPITEDELKNTKNYYVVGTDNTVIYGDLKSVNWLLDNFENIPDDIPIYFVNLHVIGSLSSDRTALLCSYDWYSAWGMDDTLVVFSDISDTLNPSSFTDGDIISTVVWKKNMRVNHVNNQDVVVIEYTTAK